mgnify:FL=1
MNQIKVHYIDSQYNALGSLDACVTDAINNNKIPIDDVFYGFFIAGVRYLMLGYRYSSGNYGTILLYKYDGSTCRWNIENGKIKKS